ncbi:GSCOCG00005306001-RA-CDS, partial [Cotesia congregata]
NTNRFSLFKWFKPKASEKQEPQNLSACSSTSSVDTLYSTTTVRSFAFHSGKIQKNDEIVTLDLLKHNQDLGPFGSGAAKIIHKNDTPDSLDVTRTLPAHVLSQKRDITTRYSLQNCSTNFGSCDNLTRLNSAGTNSNGKFEQRRLHVRGKRRAPQPPRPISVCESVSSVERRKRQAPKPPGWNQNHSMNKGIHSEKVHSNDKLDMMNQEQKTSTKYQQNPISNDTLVLRGGVLVPKVDSPLKKASSPVKISATPRPWYKRSVFENSKKLDRECGEESDVLATKVNFFREKSDVKDDKRNAKRKSGLCILTNISELDKEAAAIVQEEQAKTRAAMREQHNSSVKMDNIDKYNDNQEEVVQDIVTSSIESSPKRGTRALISKFNAIGNITKVTVNSNFFNKNMSPKLERQWNPGTSSSKERVGEAADLSRYFPGNSNKSPRSAINASRSSFLQSTLTGSTVNESDKRVTEPQKMINDVTNRLTALQSIVSTGSKDSEVKINSPIVYRREKTVLDEQIIEYKKSPRVYRAQEKSNKDIQKEFTDLFKEIDRQLNFDLKNEEPKIKSNSSAEKVSRVLDILVEKEGIKNKTDGDIKKFDKNSKATGVSDDKVTADLKEMLKEMKHSLPKRPKANKRIRESLKESMKSSEAGNLCESVVISSPPVIHVAPTTSSIASSFAVKDNKYREADKSKVSSAVQTSGNLRKVLNNPTSFAGPSTSQQWKDDVIYRTSGRSAGKGLVKNTFQLMRPREFAAIEAIKTMKITNHPNDDDNDNNTYANVMEQSLYANALVLPSRNHQIISNNRIVINDNEDDLRKKKHKILVPDAKNQTQNMNTLAVNRLLRKLEGAIASGNHQKAAGFAKDLARLKIQCSVVRQRPKVDNLLNVDMYIEDRLAHQGPIPLQLPITMTVKQLKVKIFNEFEIPGNVQRWIIGKTLAENDDATLKDLNAIEGTPVFLYLVAPELQIGDINNKQFTKVLDQIQLPEKTSTNKEPESKKTIYYPENQNKNVIKEDHGKYLLRLNDSVPKTVALPKNNDVNKMEQYKQLMMLENCDIVLNVEPIECPICFVVYDPLEGVLLRDCLHSFCRGCMENTIKYCNEAEVKCPYRDSDYTCESTLQEREIKALVNPQIYEQHLAKSVAQAENNAGHNAFHCKTPDCPGWCIYDDNVNNFLCPVCNKNNCLTCRVIKYFKLYFLIV